MENAGRQHHALDLHSCDEQAQEKIAVEHKADKAMQRFVDPRARPSK